MKYITLVALTALLLLEFSGALPDSSVGGPMALFLTFFLAMLAVGVYEAWSARRGALGWIVSIVAAIVGGLLAASVASVLVEMILWSVHVEGSLAATRHPFMYVASAGMMLFTLLGSWFALSIMNRFR